MKKEGKGIRILQKMGWGALIVEGMLVVFILLCFHVTDMTLAKGDIYSFDTGWTMIREDGTSEKIAQLPYAGTSAAGETIILENTIPQQFAGKTLEFLSADKTVVVTVDGEDIYEFGTKDRKAFGHTAGSITNFIDLPAHFTKGQIRIVMQSSYSDYAAKISDMRVGNRDVVILHLLRENLFNIVLNMIMLFCGILLAIFAVMQFFSGQSLQGMQFLSPYCLLAAIYYSIETKMLETFYGNQVLYSNLIFLILMMMPVLLLLYYQQRFPENVQSGFHVLLYLAFANIAIQLILQVSDTIDFMNMAFVSHIMIFLTILVVLFKWCEVALQERRWSFLLEFIALISFASGSVVDLARTYVVKVGDLGRYSRYGAAFFAIVMLYVHLRQIMKGYAGAFEENERLLRSEVETEKARMRQLMEAKDRAEEANRAKSRFLANMSHEIRTPINAVLGMNTLIQRESQENEIREYSNDIERSARNLLSIINDVLDFSKIESGKMEIIPAEYNLASLINDSYTMILVRAQEKHLELEVVNDPKIPSGLIGDEVRIRQIVINLLSNAVKYTDRGKITMRISYSPLGDRRILLKIAVRDTGVGIRQEDQEKLFGSFQRVDEIRNRSVQGTGLGLSITRQLLDMMGGLIRVDSVYGQGSEFTVEIPQKIASEEPMGDFAQRYLLTENTERKPYRPGIYAPDARILIVDDVEMNLKVIQGLLKQTGIRMDMARSGKICLGMVQDTRYDMIFLDDMMPEMDGTETLRRMKLLKDSQNAHTPVIMLTANALSGAKDEYLRNGFDDYIAKPVIYAELEDMIRKYLPRELQKSQKEQTEVQQEQISDDSFLQDVPEINVKLGMSYCMDTKSFYLEMLEEYLKADKRELIQEAYQKEDWENYRILVHSLKSLSLTIGAEQLSAQAKAMEAETKKQNTEYIGMHEEELIRAYTALLEKLRKAVDAEKAKT